MSLAPAHGSFEVLKDRRKARSDCRAARRFFRERRMTALTFELDPEQQEFATAFIKPHGDTSAERSHIVDRDLSTGSLTLSLSPPRQDLTPAEAAEYVTDLQRVLKIVRTTPTPCSFAWCESDHSLFEGPDWHRQTISVGSIRVELTLSSDGPRMTWGPDAGDEYAVTPGDTQSFRGLAADLSAAMDVFEVFTRSLATGDDNALTGKSRSGS